MLGAFTCCTFFSTPLQVPGLMMEPVETTRSSGPCWNWSTSWTGLTLVETSKFWWPPTALTPWTLPSWGLGVWTERLSLVFPIWRSVACVDVVVLCRILRSQADSLRSCYMWLQMSDCSFFTAHFEYPPKWCSCSAVSSYMAGAAQNCCHLCAFCVHHITMHRITGGTDTEIRVSTESWPWPRIFLRHSYRDLNPQPFDHKSSALTAELSPLPSSPLPGGVVVIKQGEVSFGITVTVWATRSPETSWKMCCSRIKLDSTPSPVLNPNPVLKPQALPRQST